MKRLVEPQVVDMLGTPIIPGDVVALGQRQGSTGARIGIYLVTGEVLPQSVKAKLLFTNWGEWFDPVIADFEKAPRRILNPSGFLNLPASYREKVVNKLASIWGRDSETVLQILNSKVTHEVR